MFSSFIKNLPSKQIWLINLIFWLLLNTFAASYTYRLALHYDRPAIFSDIWLEYLPWWGNWALCAPLIIAATATIKFDRQRLAHFIISTVSILIIIFTLYWGLTIVEVALIDNGKITAEIVHDAINRLWLSPLHIDIIVYLAILGIGYALTYYRSATEHAIKNEQLAKQLLQVELQSLKSQLNPHFLFNTLNTIASLIRLDDKSKAIKALSELSLMLRKVLENQNSQLITLQQEIEFIQSYLTIQKMRFEKKLDTKLTISGDPLHCEIPFMLLQTLVENAVQHGSQLESNKNMLTLDIKITAQKIKVTLINKVPEHDDHKGFGIGLKNCRQRMTKLYGNNFSLHLKELDNGYFETLLSLPVGVINA